MGGSALRLRVDLASPASFPGSRSRGMTYNPSSREIIGPDGGSPFFLVRLNLIRTTFLRMSKWKVH
jgi:hypothetical protein